MFPIKALILAAGYATRLYPLTKDTPKPLLTIAGKPIINYIVEELAKLQNLNQIYVITNEVFYPHFQNWAKTIKTTKEIKILNDYTLSNEDRLGSIGDIHFVIQQEKIIDPLVVIAGDNLFGFSLPRFILFHHQNNNASLVAFRDLNDKEKVKGRYGVGVLNGSKIIDFEEKPLQPKSTLAATACYLFNKKDLSKISTFLSKEKADAPGNFIKYLAKNSEVHGFVFKEHWFDVGTFESLEEAEQFYTK